MRSSSTAWALFVVAPIGLAMYAVACFSSTSTPSSNGGSGSGGAINAATGGSGGGTACDAAECADPCAKVVCPQGSFCNNAGVCASIPNCDAGTDCTTCGDLASCATCNSIAHASGWPAFNTLRDCVSCSACYLSCDGAEATAFAGGGLCHSPPSMVDACESDAGCSACSSCATNGSGSCASAAAICLANSDCQALLMAIPMCPLAPVVDGGSADGGDAGIADAAGE